MRIVGIMKFLCCKRCALQRRALKKKKNESWKKIIMKTNGTVTVRCSIRSDRCNRDDGARCK